MTSAKSSGATGRATGSTTGQSVAEALVVTDDEELIRDVEGCAAGAGAGLRVVRDVASAIRVWPGAPLVLVGADLADQAAGLGTPRREHVHLLARRPVGPEELRHAVTIGVRSVLELPDSSGHLGALLAAVVDPRPPGRVLAVTAGSGGAGASTLAAGVAVAAAAHGSVLLLATDPEGADPGLLLGAGEGPGLGWDDLARTGGVVAPTALRAALPVHRGVGLLGWNGPSRDGGARDSGAWSGAMRTAPAPVVVREVLESARQAYDLVVVDLAPGAEGPWDEVVARSDRVWVVVRPTAVGLATARSRVARSGPDLRVLVRGTGVADQVVTGVLSEPVALRVRDQRRLDESLDLGLGPLAGRRGPLARAAADVLADADVRWMG